MRNRLYLVLGLVLVVPAGVFAQEPDPAVRPPAPAATTPPALPVAEKPRPVEKPKPAEKPRALAENTSPVENAAPKPVAKPAESPAPIVTPTVAAPATAAPGAAGGGYSFACLALAFAMLIIGVAAGFVWRHLMSRRKLGGMSVRIGTWRGIP